MTTPLYYAHVLGGPTGLSFQLGPSTVFAPVDQEALYLLDPAQLLISGPVEAPMAAFLTATIIEPRLARLDCVTT
jgi:hypothetical protein